MQGTQRTALAVMASSTSLTASHAWIVPPGIRLGPLRAPTSPPEMPMPMKWIPCASNISCAEIHPSISTPPPRVSERAVDASGSHGGGALLWWSLAVSAVTAAPAAAGGGGGVGGDARWATALGEKRLTGPTSQMGTVTTEGLRLSMRSASRGSPCSGARCWRSSRCRRR
jgi:hypothetical protein